MLKSLPSLIQKIGAPAIDPDAQAFITAAGITNQTQKDAIDVFVKALKSDSLWTKAPAIYPMVGGTATAHKFNLKDPRDLDAAFRLTFTGGWTHAVTGAFPNGTNGYADTHLTPFANLSLNNLGMSYYSRTDTPGDSDSNFPSEMGILDNVRLELLIYRSYKGIHNSCVSGIANSSTSGAATSVQTDSLGFFTASRTLATQNKIYKNGALLNTNTDDWGVTVLSNINIYVGAINNQDTAGGFTDRECAMAIVHDGLTDMEAANLNTRVQAFNTSLSRNV